MQQLRPRRERAEEIAGELTFLLEQIDAADAHITGAAERLTAFERELTGAHKERDLLEQRLVTVLDGAAMWRDRLAAIGAAGPAELPDLPPLPQAPIGARVTVETLRRERADLDRRLAELRTERDRLASLDPVALREALAAAERARGDAEELVRSADAAFAEASTAREEAADAGASRRRRRGTDEQGLA